MATPRSGDGRLRLLTESERAGMDPALLEVVEYRKSGLSLNWIVGCPLDCGYCVRHLFANFTMKVPRALIGDRAAFELLTGHRIFRAHRTPIQLLNRATDPMLPAVKPHLFAMLGMLDDAGLTNHVLVITRWRIDEPDCAVLNSYRHLRVTVLVTYSGITDPRIEPVDSAIAAASLRTAHAHAQRYRVVLYWRPLVPGLNDTDAHLETALALSGHAHATVFTGLFYRAEIRAYYREHGLPEPYEHTARRKVLPEDLERRVLTAAGRRGGSPLFRKTSCAVSHVHGLPDYNGHVGIRELCDICPAPQLTRCRSAPRPRAEEVAAAAARLGGQPGRFRRPRRRGVRARRAASLPAATRPRCAGPRHRPPPSPRSPRPRRPRLAATARPSARTHRRGERRRTRRSPWGVGGAGEVVVTGLPATVFPWRRETLGHELVVVDVEGNGHQPPEIVEIALLPITSGRPVAPADLRSWLVRPTRPIAGVVTAKVHGITDADVADAPWWSDIAPEVRGLLADRVVVAHHAHVENRVLRTHLPGWEPPAVLDTMRLAKYLWPDLPGGYGLDNLIDHAGLAAPPEPLRASGDRSRRHRAAFDTWMTAALLHALLTAHRAHRDDPEGGDPGDGLAAAGRLRDNTPSRKRAIRGESAADPGGEPREGLW